MKRPTVAVQARLLAVQAAWNYERMLGLGIGFAAAPLLAPLRRTAPARHDEALARAAEFFNCNPNLAGLAVGATVRAELDGVPGVQVARLKTALGGPLGALGDRLFWAGVVPCLTALGIAAVALGAGLAAAAGVVAGYTAIRLATGRWALVTGLREGLRVGQALGASWVPRAAAAAERGAALAVGLAVPLAVAWALRGAPTRDQAVTAVVAVGGCILAARGTAHFSAARWTALAAALVFLLRTAGA